VHGAIYAKWASLGWERSALGYPTSDEYAIPGGRRNNFVHGTISWDAATGATTVALASPYTNPLRGLGALTALRIDQGVDYAGSGPVYALGPGTILDTASAGWPDGTYIAERLSTGPAAGQVVYVSENITPTVQVGQQVNANTVIGMAHDASPYIETGWGDPSGVPQALAAGQYDGSDPTGIIDGPVTGSLPPGWPTW
jgi:hypothetical protein